MPNNDFEGKKYYAWETTAKGWMPGLLPTEYSKWDMDTYWDPLIWWND